MASAAPWLLKGLEETISLNIASKTWLPGWSVTHAVSELVANAIDADPRHEVTYSAISGGVIIENGGTLRSDDWIQGGSKKATSAKENGGFGCGLKDAMAPLFRNNITVEALSDAGRFTLQKNSSKDYLEVVYAPGAKHDVPTGRTRFILRGANLPTQDQVVLLKSTLKMTGQAPDGTLTVWPKEPHEKGGITVWIRGIYRFDAPELPRLPGNFHFNIERLTEDMQRQLGRDRRNASTNVLRPFIKKGYRVLQDKKISIDGTIPSEYRPKATKAEKKQAKKQSPTTGSGAKQQGAAAPDVATLQQRLQEEANKYNALMKNLADVKSELSLVRSGQSESKKKNECLECYEMLAKAHVSDLINLRLAKADDRESNRIRDWNQGIKASPTFFEEIDELKDLLQREFPTLAHYGSSANPSIATTDSDVDLMVVADASEEQMRSRLAKFKRLVVLSERATTVPNLRSASMFHFRFKDLVGELVWVPDQTIFDESKKKRDADPLLKLEKKVEREARVALKRIKRDAFCGLYPKSRMLHHFVHKASSKVGPSAELCSLLAESLRQWEAVSRFNFDYYDRYTEAEWTFMKDIVHRVKKHWHFQ